MADPTCHQFIVQLEPHRDRLYTAALATVATPDAAEGTLQRALRAGVRQYLKEPPRSDFAAFINAFLPKPPEASTEPQPLTPMPAPVWARLTAAIQVEAAQLGGSSALNPESVLLTPDPLLTPKNRPPRPRDPDEVARPATRFIVAAAVALLVGVALTILVVKTKRSAPHSPAASQPAEK